MRDAAKELNEGVEDANIIVIDSKCASLGQGMFVYQAVKMRDQGATIGQVATYLEEHKMSFSHVLTANEMVYLYRGNKIQKSGLYLSLLTGVRVILCINKNGEMVMHSKIRGRKKALKALVDLMESTITMNREDNETIFISHCDCVDEAQIVADEVKKRFGIENIVINMMGPAIGAHVGPGTVCLFYRGSIRE